MSEAVTQMQEKAEKILDVKETTEFQQMSSELNDARAENETLSQELEKVLTMYNALNQTLVTRAEALKEGVRAQGGTGEATAEAERAAMQHAEECKRLTSQMAVRMKREADEGRNPNPNAQHQRLLDELKAMAVSKKKSDDELAALQEEQAKVMKGMASMASDLRDAKTRLVEGKSRISKLEEQLRLAKLTSDVGMVSGDVDDARAQQLRELATELEKLRDERSAAEEALQAALHDVGFFQTENKTLSEQIRDLVGSSHAAKAELEKLRDERSAVEKSLQTALDEIGLYETKNKSLSEQIRDLVKSSTAHLAEAQSCRTRG